METPRPLPLLRSLLFFPGSRPALFEKARASGADAVCLDLEDSVAPSEKEGARRAVVELLSGTSPRPGPPTLVRINPLHTPTGRDDLAALLQDPASVTGIVLPKVEDGRVVQEVGDALEESGAHAFLLPLVETPRALESVAAIAGGSPRVWAVLLGTVDLALALGADGSWESLQYARSRLVHGAAGAGVDPVDGPFMDLSDPAGLAEEARRARALGFRGKIVVHPGQVDPVREAFSPRPEEVARARRIVEADEGASLVDGRVVERPVIEEARRILALADRTEGR